jgi:hypothetical protein
MQTPLLPLWRTSIGVQHLLSKRLDGLTLHLTRTFITRLHDLTCACEVQLPLRIFPDTSEFQALRLSGPLLQYSINVAPKSGWPGFSVRVDEPKFGTGLAVNLTLRVSSTESDRQVSRRLGW